MASFDAKTFLKTLTERPGVYQFYDTEGHVLYVGKAKNLKRRVQSYFRAPFSPKIQKLHERFAHIDVTVTDSEDAAFVLEASLIKQHKPRYNVLLRDDKSYPYISLSTGTFPRLSFYRGKPTPQQNLFGPYPSAQSVRMTLFWLQKIFRLRQCKDTEFKHRSRPCLQYQIKRCHAPCVGLISKEEYAQDVQRARLFLKGKGHTVLDELKAKMLKLSDSKSYEQAALVRDQMAALQQIQEKRAFKTGKKVDADVLGVAVLGKEASIAVLSIRGGILLGVKTYTPKLPDRLSEEEVCHAFITQHYVENPADIPKQLMVSHAILEQTWCEQVLSSLKQQRVSIRVNPKGDWQSSLSLVKENAWLTLKQRASQLFERQAAWKALQEFLNLQKIPNRVECFDISHHHGDAAVGAMVVWEETGPNRQRYRRFGLKETNRSDDYGAMQEVFSRRYRKVEEWPDVILVDGGKGQLSAVDKILNTLEKPDSVHVLGISKGPGRRAVWDTVWFERNPIHLDDATDTVMLLQSIRDEAHRFALAGHHKKKRFKGSILEMVPGVGEKKAKALLQHFGGLKRLKGASLEEFKKVPGISDALAQSIWAWVHRDV